MNREEYENSEDVFIEQRSVDCFCDQACTSLRVSAYVAHVKYPKEKCYGWTGVTDDIDFTLRVKPWYAKEYTLNSIWSRIKACWQLFFRGQYDVYWCTGKLRDWKKVADWINSLTPVEEEGKKDKQLKLFN